MVGRSAARDLTFVLRTIRLILQHLLVGVLRIHVQPGFTWRTNPIVFALNEGMVMDSIPVVRVTEIAFHGTALYTECSEGGGSNTTLIQPFFVATGHSVLCRRAPDVKYHSVVTPPSRVKADCGLLTGVCRMNGWTTRSGWPEVWRLR